MRILALADIHGSPHGEATVRNFVKQTGPDAIAIAGDLTGPSGIPSTRELLAGLLVPTFVVPGNMDGGVAAAAFTVGKALNIDLEKAVLADIGFIGLGGNTVPVAERRGIASELGAIEQKLEGLMALRTVIVTHMPPFGHLDSVPVPPAFSSLPDQVEHIGSQFIRKMVDRLHPLLVISGHVHEHRGIEKEADTMYVNPGPARDGFGALIELKKRPSARLLESG